MTEKTVLDRVILVIGSIFGVISLIFLTAFVRGWALVKMWDWFIVPTFGVPHISIAIAVGMCLTINLFYAGYAKPDSDDSTTKQIVVAFVAPILTVGFGYLVLQFV